MEFCKHCNVRGYSSLCDCELSGNLCVYVFRCQAEMMWKPLDGMDKCSLRLEQIPTLSKGEYFVRFEKDGFLYVEYENDTVIKIENTLNYIPKVVKIDVVDGEYQIVKEKKSAK